jgi:hypothetical protein
VIPQLPVPHCSNGRQLRPQVATLVETSNLVEQPEFHHSGESTDDALSQRLAVARREDQLQVTSPGGSPEILTPP